MPSTCFKTEGISSGRRLYVQVWYGIACLRAEITVKDLYKLSNYRVFELWTQRYKQKHRS